MSTSTGSLGSGLSSGATIAIAVCAAVVGLGVIVLAAFWLRWRRRRRLNESHGGSQRPSGPPAGTQDMAQNPSRAPPPYGGGIQSTTAPSTVEANHATNMAGRHDLGQDDIQWTEVDEDRLAQRRRFSNEGTVATFDQTVAGKTHDDFRPQGA